MSAPRPTTLWRADVAARTHRGLVRGDNQDVLVVDGWACCADASRSDPRQIPLDRPVGLAVVDGMGGHHGGAVAAWLTAHRIARESSGLADSATADEFARQMHDFVSDAGAGLGMPEMGAAFAALLLHREGYAVANVGDCRVYGIREGRLAMLSVDDLGPSRLDPTHEVLTQSIGGGGRYLVDTHFFATPWPRGGSQRFVLATDGLAIVDPDALRGIGSTGSPDDAAASLLSIALEAGAPDNVSLIVVDVAPAGPDSARPEVRSDGG